MIRGLSHITLIVADLRKSADLFAELFGAKEIYDSGETTHSRSKEKFFLVNDLWIALMQGEPLTQRTYNHIAFRISDDEFDGCLRRIKGLGLDVLTDRNRMPGEGRSIYFYDYDNHLFELHTGSLEDRLAAYVTE